MSAQTEVRQANEPCAQLDAQRTEERKQSGSDNPAQVDSFDSDSLYANVSGSLLVSFRIQDVLQLCVHSAAHIPSFRPEP